MATYEQVHADITHIHTMLEEQKNTLPDGHNMTSAIASQAAGVLQMLRNLTGLNHEQSMQMQRLVLAGPWTGQQKGEFADVLTSHHSTGALSSSPRRQLVESFSAYLTLEDVQKLSDPQHSLLAKIQVLADRCVSVGIVRPLEKSWKPIVAAGIAAGMTMQTHERLPYLEELKRLVAKGKNARGMPEPYLTTYPHDPTDLPPALKQCFAGSTMGGVEEGQGLAACSQVDLRRSSKSQRTESMAMLPSRPKGPMMGAGMGSMPGGAACGGFDPGMMMMMGAQYFMSMMQQGVNPFGKGNPARPEDLVYLTPKGKGMAAPPVPCKSPPDESQDTQESQPHEVKPAGVRPLKLFDTGDETDDQPAPETSSQKPLDAKQQAKVVEDAIDHRSKAAKMKRPAAAVPESKPKKIEPTKAVKKDKEPLKMDRKNLHSRTYTAAKLKGLKEGMTLEDACVKASKVAAAELKKHGYEPHPKKRPCSKSSKKK